MLGVFVEIRQENFQYQNFKLQINCAKTIAVTANDLNDRNNYCSCCHYGYSRGRIFQA